MVNTKTSELSPSVFGLVQRFLYIQSMDAAHITYASFSSESFSDLFSVL